MPKPKDSPLVAPSRRSLPDWGGGITEDRVREIVREEILAQLPQDEPAAEDGSSTTGLTHPKVDRRELPAYAARGKHGKKCRLALEAAA
jgi:hypothetical protein